MVVQNLARHYIILVITIHQNNEPEVVYIYIIHQNHAPYKAQHDDIEQRQCEVVVQNLALHRLQYVLASHEGAYDPEDCGEDQVEGDEEAEQSSDGRHFAIGLKKRKK